MDSIIAEITVVVFIVGEIQLASPVFQVLLEVAFVYCPAVINEFEVCVVERMVKYSCVFVVEHS